VVRAGSEAVAGFEGEVGIVERAFETTAQNGDNAGERVRGAFGRGRGCGVREEREQILCEAQTAVVVQRKLLIEAFGRFCVPSASMARPIPHERKHTIPPLRSHDPRAQKEQINLILLPLDLLAHLVHIAQEADIALDERDLSVFVYFRELGCQVVGGFLTASDEVDSGGGCVADEFAGGAFADS
jgi:hypothetical protein